MPQVKRYLGDSVYAEFDGYHVVLTTENGYGPSNTIFLEPAIIKQLFDYCESLDNHQPTPVKDQTAMGTSIVA